MGRKFQCPKWPFTLRLVRAIDSIIAMIGFNAQSGLSRCDGGEGCTLRSANMKQKFQCPKWPFTLRHVRRRIWLHRLGLLVSMPKVAFHVATGEIPRTAYRQKQSFNAQSGLSRCDFYTGEASERDCKPPFQCPKWPFTLRLP